ncbi:hypothetical protein [Streptomyces sp. Ag109_O5-10]|uniref:hypothetical protein n=1 Tax=Streptomyces sp. Ag109_O5-10 TaxID=1855349 RepID=UPI00115FC245|nr:hypothetical protein [Streptomyces sp. Ag109_O5-10]
MTSQEMDEALSAMARGSSLLLRECESERRRMEELNALSEAAIERRIEDQGSVYEADSVLLSVRSALATSCAKGHRDAAREFVCWWLDAALAAWKSAVQGTPLLYARVSAAAPNTLMTDDDLAVLPKADERTRQLVELGAFLGPGPVSDYDDGLAAMTADLAARSGLLVGQDEAGNIRLLDGADPEARRRRLWGDFWLEHGIPALPEPDELDLLLDRGPGEVAGRLRSAVQAVIQATMAGSRIAEMESHEAPWTPAEVEEYDRLSDQLSLLTNLLADLAQAITDNLPAIRTTAPAAIEATATEPRGPAG